MSLVALIIEDQKFDAALFSSMLDKVADKVYVAADLKSAMTLVNELPDLHLVTLDLIMPDSTVADSLGSIAEIRKRHPNCTVVVVTGDTSDSTRRDITRANPDGLIFKPEACSTALLMQVILKALKKRVNGDNEVMRRVSELLEKLSAIQPNGKPL